ncbi:PrsW family intramembrane metalloprotease [Tsukamurella soli]|uniref:PrsW family intramembrane metalloprotease n=1 Tax=Tsukamurella soli TaxID=644556 RepID=UPI00361001EA
MYVAGLLAGLGYLALHLVRQVLFTAAGVVVALPVILIAAALVGVIIAALDVSRVRVLSAAVLALAWGGIAATGMAMFINGLAGVAINDVLDDPASARWNAAIAGPVDEETLKAVGVLLILVLFRAEIRRPLQGFVVGACVGLGFQILENITYASTLAIKDAQSDVGGALLVSGVRAVTGFQSHWVYTGIYGVGLTVLLHRGTRSRGPRPPRRSASASSPTSCTAGGTRRDPTRPASLCY